MGLSIIITHVYFRVPSCLGTSHMCNSMPNLSIDTSTPPRIVGPRFHGQTWPHFLLRILAKSGQTAMVRSPRSFVHFVQTFLNMLVSCRHDGVAPGKSSMFMGSSINIPSIWAMETPNRGPTCPSPVPSEVRWSSKLVKEGHSYGPKFHWILKKTPHLESHW